MKCVLSQNADKGSSAQVTSVQKLENWDNTCCLIDLCLCVVTVTSKKAGLVAVLAFTLLKIIVQTQQATILGQEVDEVKEVYTPEYKNSSTSYSSLILMAVGRLI